MLIFYRSLNFLLPFQAVLVMVCAIFYGGSTGEARGQLDFSTVIIDPGHGGRDKGRISGKYHEKHYTLDVAERLEKILRAEGLKVVMTRTDDTTVSLEERAQQANLWGRSVFVSIHFNAHVNSRYRGIETFYMSPNGRVLAQAIQRSLIKRTGTRNRGIKFTDFYVLRETNMPAALVECGFMSNPTDLALALNEGYRQKLAEAIAKGLLATRN